MCVFKSEITEIRELARGQRGLRLQEKGTELRYIKADREVTGKTNSVVVGGQGRGADMGKDDETR